MQGEGTPQGECEGGRRGSHLSIMGIFLSVTMHRVILFLGPPSVWSYCHSLTSRPPHWQLALAAGPSLACALATPSNCTKAVSTCLRSSYAQVTVPYCVLVREPVHCGSHGCKVSGMIEVTLPA